MSVTQVTAQQPEFLLHYQLGQSLGEGGFGQVFQAWDTKLHRQVAIKYLKNVSAGVDLLREARLAASLQHPAFVKVHALEQTSDSQAIVMEMVPGRTLRQLLEDAATEYPSSSRYCSSSRAGNAGGTRRGPYSWRPQTLEFNARARWRSPHFGFWSGESSRSRCDNIGSASRPSRHHSLYGT